MPPVPPLGSLPPLAALSLEFEVPPAPGLLLVVLFAPPDAVVDFVPLPPTAAELFAARVPPAERELELFDAPPALELVSSAFAVPPASPLPSSLLDAEAPPLPVSALGFADVPPFEAVALFVEPRAEPPTFEAEPFEELPPAPGSPVVSEPSLGIAVPSSPPLQAVVESAYATAAK